MTVAVESTTKQTFVGTILVDRLVVQIHAMVKTKTTHAPVKAQPRHIVNITVANHCGAPQNNAKKVIFYGSHQNAVKNQ